MKNDNSFKAFRIRFPEPDIVHVEFKKVKELHPRDVQDLYSFIREQSNNESLFYIISFKGFLPMKEDVMAEVKKNRDRMNTHLSVCIIRNTALRLSIQFFLSFYGTKKKIHFVSSYEKAMALIRNKRK